MTWVSRIFAVSCVMFLPGLGGQWLDNRWQTSCFTLIGFAAGLVAGFAFLLTMTRQPMGPTLTRDRDDDQDSATPISRGSDADPSGIET